MRVLVEFAETLLFLLGGVVLVGALAHVLGWLLARRRTAQLVWRAWNVLGALFLGLGVLGMAYAWGGWASSPAGAVSFSGWGSSSPPPASGCWSRSERGRSSAAGGAGVQCDAFPGSSIGRAGGCRVGSVPTERRDGKAGEFREPYVREDRGILSEALGRELARGTVQRLDRKVVLRRSGSERRGKCPPPTGARRAPTGMR